MIALSVPSKLWRPLAATVAVGFWAMGSRPMATSTVVPTVPAKPAYRGYRIAATEVIEAFGYAAWPHEAVHAMSCLRYTAVPVRF